ncbi:MAG: hypothetical protein JWN44_188 [Myxococcales bacterium]|nr:hypothetical protein [Myxococcales bacterium]
MWKRFVITIPAAVLSLTLLGGAEGIDKGELECEEAVKHLLDCCPNDGPIKMISCYEGRFCDHASPDLSGATSRCMRDASCDDLYASGACDAPKTTVCQ